jgi:hypothetical protein
VPDHGEGREGIGASTVEHRAHPTQWLDDTSDRTAAQRRVAVKDRGHRQAGEHPGDQRRLVPELPQSRIASGSRRPSAPGDATRYARSGHRLGSHSTVAPSARMIAAVERTSAPSPAPVIRLSPWPAPRGSALGG